MIHKDIEDELNGRRYGVSHNGVWVLVQLDNGSAQTRISISPDQAEHMATLLQQHAQGVKTSS